MERIDGRGNEFIREEWNMGHGINPERKKECRLQVGL